MKVTNVKNFGQAIREKRKKLNYTQAFLADFSGLSVSFISDLENGKSSCEIGKAIYLVNILGIDCILSNRGEE